MKRITVFFLILVVFIALSGRTVNYIRPKISDATAGQFLVFDAQGKVINTSSISITVGSFADGSAAAPSITFASDTDTGIYLSSAGNFRFATGGSSRFGISGNTFYAKNAAGPLLSNAAATSTVPTLSPNQADPNTGIGSAAADQLSLIAGGVEGVRITESTTITGSLIGEWTTTGDFVIDADLFTLGVADVGSQVMIWDGIDTTYEGDLYWSWDNAMFQASGYNNSSNNDCSFQWITGDHYGSFYIGTAYGESCIYTGGSGDEVYITGTKVILGDSYSVYNDVILVIDQTTKTYTFEKGSAIIGDGEASVDYYWKFDGETNDGIITFMEDEGYFDFDSGIKIHGEHWHDVTVTSDNHYDPSALTDDHILKFTGLTADKNCIISTEDEDTGSVTSERFFEIKNASAANNVTVTLESGGTIDGAANVVLAPYDSVTLGIDGTNANIY